MSYRYALLLISFPTIVWAAANPQDLLASSGQWMELQHDNVSTWVNSSASAVDRYVARDVFDDALINKSYVRLRLKQRIQKAGEHELEADVKISVDLPASKRRAKFFFDSSSDDFDDLDDQYRNVSTGNSRDSDNTDQAILGIRFSSDKILSWNPSIDIGAKVSTPFNPYVRLRVRRIDNWGEHWSTYFRQSVFDYKVDGWGAKTELDIYRPFSKHFLFRSASVASYIDQAYSEDGEDKNWQFYQAYSLYQSINENHAMEYQVAITAEKQPQRHKTNYWLRMEWQQHLYKQWLFLNISPEVSFPEERDFDYVPAIFFELEVFFTQAKGLKSIHAQGYRSE